MTDTAHYAEISADVIAAALQEALDTTGNLAHLIPLLFRYKNEPVTLNQHYPSEICFYQKRPRRVIKRCGRQVGKSFQNGVELLLRAIVFPGWNSLYVTPLFEQVRRFSTQYVGALIDESPLRNYLLSGSASNQVLQRTLGNGSTMYFTYAFRDADRARGANANDVWYDEIQLMNREVIPVLQQVMGGSPYGEYEVFAGTSLSYGNLIEEFFNSSTMSEWMIPCRKCGYDNVACTEYDLLNMIGPVRPDIHPGGYDADGKKIPRVSGLVCARCSSSSKGLDSLVPIFPEDGHWFHRAPERREDFLGIHIPQPIAAWHAYSVDRWRKLNERLTNGSDVEVYNEIFGEPCDSGFKPISIEDLKRAAVLGHKNNLQDALNVSKRYARLAMGIDWGGGGMKGYSRTKAAIVGITTSGKSDVLYGVDLNFSHDAFEETRVLMTIAMAFGVELIAHDVGGNVGSTREQLMYQTKTLNAEIWPMSYVGVLSQQMVKLQVGAVEGQTATLSVDKSKSITFLCQALKQGLVRTFEFDYVNKDNPGLLYDFTTLISEISASDTRSDRLIITKEEGLSDDFVHAVNFGLLGLWVKHGAFPQLANHQAAADIKSLIDNIRSIRPQSHSVEEIEGMLRMMGHSHRR